RLRTRQTNEYVNADAELNAEDIVRCPRQFGVFPNVATEVEDVDKIEVAFEVFAHPVTRDTIHKSAVCYVGDNALLSNAVRGKANSFDIWITQTVSECGFRISHVCQANTL